MQLLTGCLARCDIGTQKLAQRRNEASDERGAVFSLNSRLSSQSGVITVTCEIVAARAAITVYGGGSKWRLVILTDRSSNDRVALL
ncbi:unnamed protein product, partial [Iphiclides podalirius]